MALAGLRSWAARHWRVRVSASVRRRLPSRLHLRSDATPVSSQLSWANLSSLSSSSLSSQLGLRVFRLDKKQVCAAGYSPGTPSPVSALPLLFSVFPFLGRLYSELQSRAEAENISWEVLQRQDDLTSAMIIESLRDDPAFLEFTQKEMDGIIQRDLQDAEKLQKGVDEAIERGVLPNDTAPPQYEQIDVLGKTADQVAEDIVAKLPKGEGCVVIIVGLSGTGKGTTVDKIKAKVPNATTWSNGNCFRSLTLLAATHCEQQGKDSFDPSCLTPENLAKWVGMLEFGKFGDAFDIRINGLGIDVKVSEVANTLLKEPKVGKNIPTVAEKTQGEVVRFAGDAVAKMGEAGSIVLLEGREQTLNFIPSPYRFCLMMSNSSAIGQRRAAQRIGALTVSRTKESGDIVTALKKSLTELTAG